jgi:hypothetical protein
MAGHEHKMKMKIALFLFTFMLLKLASWAQSGAASDSPPPVTFTADQDQKNMMQQLGIRALRPGASSNEKDPNYANYDENKANPYPKVPDALTLNDGTKVTTAELWQKRRAQIIEAFDCCVYGRVPKDVPRVNWTPRAKGG